MSFILIMIAVNIALIGISSRANAYHFNLSERVFDPLEGCAEEALIQLSRDNSYTGGNYTIDEVACTATVSGSDPTRDVVVTGGKKDITRDVFIRVQLTPAFAIMVWDD